MTQEQELAKLRADLTEAKRKARQYENRVAVLTNNQRDKERRERTRRMIERGLEKTGVSCVAEIVLLFVSAICWILARISSGISSS